MSYLRIVFVCIFSSCLLFSFPSIAENFYPTKFDAKEWFSTYYQRYQQPHPDVSKILRRLDSLGKYSDRWKVSEKHRADQIKLLHLALAHQTHDFPLSRLSALILVESRFNPGAFSPAGAQGATQIVTRHWSTLLGKDFNPYNLSHSVTGCIKILTALASHRSPTIAIERYNGAGPVAIAYREDVLAVQRYLESGKITARL